MFDFIKRYRVRKALKSVAVELLRLEDTAEEAIKERQKALRGQVPPPERALREKFTLDADFRAEVLATAVLDEAGTLKSTLLEDLRSSESIKTLRAVVLIDKQALHARLAMYARYLELLETAARLADSGDIETLALLPSGVDFLDVQEARDFMRQALCSAEERQ